MDTQAGGSFSQVVVAVPFRLASRVGDQFEGGGGGGCDLAFGVDDA